MKLTFCTDGKPDVLDYRADMVPDLRYDHRTCAYYDREGRVQYRTYKGLNTAFDITFSKVKWETPSETEIPKDLRMLVLLNLIAKD